MFEWLKNILFDEDVEVEEAALEEINFSGEEDFNEIIKAPKPKVNEPQREEKVSGVEEKKPEIEIRTDFNIQLKDEQPKNDKLPEVKVRSEREKRAERVSERASKDIEISSVISPMFGGNEEKTVESLTPKSPVVKKKDGLGTVISPMYGQAELSVHEQIARNAIKENEKEASVLFEENDDWKDEIPLEELISKEEENDDCVQFSLFGETSNK